MLGFRIQTFLRFVKQTESTKFQLWLLLVWNIEMQGEGLWSAVFQLINSLKSAWQNKNACTLIKGCGSSTTCHGWWPCMSVCGTDTVLMNGFIKKLQFGIEKCHKMHVGRKTCFYSDLFIYNWKVQEISEFDYEEIWDIF